MKLDKFRSRVLSAVFVLMSVHAGLAQDAVPPPSPVDAAVEKLAAKEPAIRRQGIEELSRLRAPRAIPGLLARLDDENAFVRAAAADCLGLMRVSEAVPKISRLLTGDPEKQVRQSAAIALTYLADPSSADALIQALGDPFEGVRYAAARSLGSMRSTKAVPALVKMLQDQDPQLRATCAGALGLIGSKEASSALIEALRDNHAPVRQEAAKALGMVGDASAVEPLKKILADPEVGVSVQSALALQRLGDPSGIGVGLKLLAGGDAGARQQAAGLLGIMGDKERALPALQDALKAEKDAATKQVIDFNLAQLKARLGVKEPAPEPLPTAAPTPTPKTAGKKKKPSKKKKSADPRTAPVSGKTP